MTKLPLMVRLQFPIPLGNVIKGWDGYLNKPNKPSITNPSQKKAKFFMSERVFSDSSTTSRLRREEPMQDRAVLKRKAPYSISKLEKGIDRLKLPKKSKSKKTKQKQRKKPLFEASSEGFGMSVAGNELKESEDAEKGDNSLGSVNETPRDDGNAEP